MEWWLPGVKEGGSGELLFNGYRLSVWDDGKFLEMDSGDGFSTLYKYLKPLNCILKRG